MPNTSLFGLFGYYSCMDSAYLAMAWIRRSYYPLHIYYKLFGRLSWFSGFLRPRLKSQALTIHISAAVPWCSLRCRSYRLCPFYTLWLSSHPSSSQSLVGTYASRGLYAAHCYRCGYDYNFPLHHYCHCRAQWLIQPRWITASILRPHLSRRTYGPTTSGAEQLS